MTRRWLAFAPLAERLRTTPTRRRRACSTARSAKIADAVAEAARQHALRADVPLVALGGAGEALVPRVAELLGRPMVRPEHPEVLSSIGAALSLVRAELTRNGAATAPPSSSRARPSGVRRGRRRAGDGHGRDGLRRRATASCARSRPAPSRSRPAPPGASRPTTRRASRRRPTALELAPAGLHAGRRERLLPRLLRERLRPGRRGRRARRHPGRRGRAPRLRRRGSRVRRAAAARGRRGHARARRRDDAAARLARLRLAHPRPLRRAAARGRAAAARAHARGPPGTAVAVVAR